ncbi:MAG TPA: DUF2249 domain-containing protein [Albitalea sp.]|nr:DUF2249 domain-containing protein [Albitalea sp.]
MSGDALARQWREDDAAHIDVRGLPPPQPLVAILRLVHTVQAIDGALPVIAHLDRDPVMLYPELAQIGWQAERIAGDANEVRLLLRRLP